ncbi:MAG: patatin-like phospholipase family protein [Proteobacteria bacterium]|nr:patatin-like phospholipase family protein [Pseudomonadota bacterium]
MPRRIAPRSRHFAAVLFTLGLTSACAAPARIAYTAAEQRAAIPPGFADVRLAIAEPAEAEKLVDYFRAERAQRGRPLEILSLSGGGANGAYGAGVLYGWSQHGDRPTFDVVTGISTGALAAPFAFLGPAYDEALKAGYTGGQSADLLDFRGFLAFFRPSLFSGGPLERLVTDLVDDRVVAAVAKEHRAGRRLLVGTTNLDTQTLTLWDMGAIALVGGPQATQLFRRVLIASASVPGIFPPVMIDVQAKGRHFTEMHVDGSAVTSFFAVPDSLLLWTDQETGEMKARLYVLVNGALDVAFVVTPNETLSILRRSFDVASKTNTRTELTAVAAFAKRNGLDLSVSYVPPGMNPSPLDFNQQRMTALFEKGRSLGAGGAAWDTLEDGAP